MLGYRAANARSYQGDPGFRRGDDRVHIKSETTERHTLAVVVDNEPGILARIAGLFTARGYNIESLTVSEITEDKSVSRITIVTSASAHVLEQIVAQLDRLVPVHTVRDLTAEGAHVERELALVKVAGVGDHRIEALRLADVYRARVVDATTSSFVFEVTGGREKIDTFVGLMGEVGLVEVARTGIVAIARGREGA
jgi:acetolactate synthase-1/3 small subunit